MSRFEQLNENTPTMIQIGNYDEAPDIITELQNEIRVKMKGKFDFSYEEIQTEIINKVKELIDVWTPEIDFTVDFHTEEKEEGGVVSEVEIRKNNDKKIEEMFRIYVNIEKAWAKIEKAKAEFRRDHHSKEDKNYEVDKKALYNYIDGTCNYIDDTCNEKHRILDSADTITANTIIKPCWELRINDTQKTLNDKIDNWLENLISVMQYPLLKEGKGIIAIFLPLARVYDYDANDKTDNEIFVEKVKRLLENNFEFQTVDCQGDYDSTDYFEFTQYPEIDEVVTKRKAIIYKYENRTQIIKGEAYTPCNNSSFMETDETNTSPNEGDVATYNDSSYEE